MSRRTHPLPPASGGQSTKNTGIASLVLVAILALMIADAHDVPLEFATDPPTATVTVPEAQRIPPALDAAEG